MVSLDKVTVRYGSFELIRESSFLIRAEDRIGLIGKNGAGKSTLLKLIAGITVPTSGTVNIPKDSTIGYLPQEMKLTNKRTLMDETLQAFEELLQLERVIFRLNQEISTSTDFHSEAYLNKLDLLTELNERYTILGGDTYEAAAEQTLTGLGFERSDFQRPTSEFSGGWRMRVELAKLLLKKPDLILLDEPTNHLDIESIQWLEEFLKNYKGAVILVSHDKAFLDAVSNRTLEISLGKLTDQRMNYSAFVRWKKEQQEILRASHKNQQKMIEETEKFIERFRYKATKAVQVQSRIKQLEKLEKIEMEEEDIAGFRIHFPPAPRSGKVVAEAKNVTKYYDLHRVLNDIDLTLERGEKVAFVGRNGEGKTTLVRAILNEISYQGTIALGHNVKIGYFAQNQEQKLNEERTVYETIDEIAIGEVRTKIRDILGAFLFSGEDVDKKVKVLSGGEKSRLAMIRLMLEPVNLLVLDEPTNHLDMPSKEILKKALIQFDGTVLVVSHDREFLDGMINCVYEFSHQKIRQHLGGIYDFLEKKKMDSLKALEKRKSNALYNSQSGREKNGERKLNFEERKKIIKSISRSEKRVAEYESRIEYLEGEMHRMNALLSSSGTDVDHEVFEKYEQLKGALEKTMDEWEKEHGVLEKWKLRKTW